MKLKTLLLISVYTIVLCSCKKNEVIGEAQACFESQPNVITDNIIQFVNCSENATDYLWKFNDGETSTEKEPTHIFEISPPFQITLIAYNETSTDTINQILYADIHTYKPNIYIYPTHDIELCLQLSFPLGGHITVSDPQYDNGWCFHVDTSGKIDDQYNYLFYESIHPNLFQYKSGWCIEQTDLKSFFERNMSDYNFSGSEIKDFTDYWIPRLKEYNYYCIYPQTNTIIDQVIQFNFSIQPDRIGRLFYGVIGENEQKILTTPTITPFERNGFFITEWGVFLE